MIDTSTNKELRVRAGGTAWPYLMVTLDQLAEVRRHLDQHKVPYSVDEDAISLDGELETVFVDFVRGADAPAIQAILDGIH